MPLYFYKSCLQVIYFLFEIAYFENYKGIITLEHFKLGEKAIDFINDFPEKHKIFLLADWKPII